MRALLAKVVRDGARRCAVAVVSVLRRVTGRRVAVANVGVLIGGPLDGGELAPAARPGFVWVSAKQQTMASSGRPRFAAYVKPAKGRALYRNVGDDTFLYAGHSYALCSCGGYNDIGEGERNPRCQLCDAPLTRPSDLLV